ncbi:hypothetical protein GLAREA_08246 [Glarea lozoyensis ATCC 20868]|uniref:F-box domain-containing protein n=1 Tax=Glarea lozoyensis (strain ATCC 20868 / MF5171) TaxID=1116229 RepID=S3CGK8_GLAL2|nr:uncharacterized protein GLAREA_08246 [Glarea lozoyensis ATCC 20868]EPE24394.1 hypothetical protein GLAREA_08246 [Glarea lozoyensis ATCC 20868]
MDDSTQLVKLMETARLTKPADEPSTSQSHDTKLRPSALESSVLKNVPVDLILEINKHLPPASKQVLALSCRPMHFTLGSQHYKQLKERSHAFELLTLLAREKPDHIACYHCHKYHSISEARRMGHDSDRVESPCGANDQYLHGNFTFTIFQMAMKCYSQSVGYTDLLRSISHQSTWYCIGQNYLHHLTIVPKITQGSMIIRAQVVLVKSSARPFRRHIYYKLNICPHISLIWDTRSDAIGFVQGGQLPGSDPEVHVNGPGVTNKCFYCHTDYSVEYHTPAENIQAACITRWRDIGGGLSPLDKQFRNHVNRNYQSFDPNRESVWDKFEETRDPAFVAMNIIPRQEMDGIVNEFCRSAGLRRDERSSEMMEI